MVLTPILKGSLDSKMASGSPNLSRVSFTLPEDEIQSVIHFLSDDEGGIHAERLSKVSKILLSKESADATVKKWLEEFKDHIFFLDNGNERLVFTILKMQWLTRDDSFVTLYQDLILNLVSAHPFYIKPVLATIIELFSSSELECSDDDVITEDESKRFHNIHELLKQILLLLPMSRELLCTALLDRFPYIKRSAHILECYTQNMLTVSTYLGHKRPLILEHLFRKMIFIDVQCSKEIIDFYEMQREDDMLFKMEQENGDGGCSEKKFAGMAYPLAHTLDVLMATMFEYTHTTCHRKHEKLNWDATKKIYKEMLTVFDKIVLPTCESCHIQFLMFYICSLKQELCDGFLDYLWKKIQNPNVAPSIRQIAAFYIGSFLARASYINISTVMACFNLMCNWIHRYIDNDSVITADVRMHGTFHSVCQAVFYVFVFRNKELLEMKNSHKYLRGLNLDRIITSRLNPLKYCDRTIVQNFASVARNCQIVYCYPVLEKNNRSLVCESADSSSRPSGALIHTFFPFDPYVLKRSKSWVENIYRVYNARADEELEEMDCTEQEEAANQLFSYSTSPGFKESKTKSSLHR